MTSNHDRASPAQWDKRLSLGARNITTPRGVKEESEGWLQMALRTRLWQSLVTISSRQGIIVYVFEHFSLCSFTRRFFYQISVVSETTALSQTWVSAIPQSPRSVLHVRIRNSIGSLADSRVCTAVTAHCSLRSFARVRASGRRLYPGTISIHITASIVRSAGFAPSCDVFECLRRRNTNTGVVGPVRIDSNGQGRNRTLR